jgi:UDP-N-acetylmuramoylalanine--D-glutamate ligase
MSNQTAAVIGFGKTGKAVLDFFLGRNSNKTLYLYNDTPITGNESRQHYESCGVVFLVGEENFSKLHTVELIILSPGVDATAPRFKPLRENGVKIVSEIELAFAFIHARVIAVTGTNGKSTTVSLTHHILETAGIKSFLTGNIGTPLISQVDKITPDSVVVIEVSSFQLEEILQFKPDIALILNITPDHLDRYKEIDAYFTAKLKLTRNQTHEDYLVLNGDDIVLTDEANMDRFGMAKILWFSRDCHTPGAHVCLSGDSIQLKFNDSPDSTVEIVSLANNPLRGVHNLENILAAVTATSLAGVSTKDIEAGISSFTGLTHRMESAGKIGNVEFINDSKATNVDATLKSISSIDEPMVLILGGKDKGGDFTILEETIRQRVNVLLLMGHAAGIIREQLKNLEDLMIDVKGFPEAVSKGHELLAEKGGVVLLAPGCASFDMFKNFEHRGQCFKDEVATLAQKRIG